MDHSKTKSSKTPTKPGNNAPYRLPGKDLLPGPARRAGLTGVPGEGLNWEGSKN